MLRLERLISGCQANRPASERLKSLWKLLPAIELLKANVVRDARAEGMSWADIAETLHADEIELQFDLAGWGIE